jgi:hypothetical protein
MDRQRDTIAILRFMLFKRQRQNSFNLYQGPLKSKESKIFAMLNWIAACFVTEPIGDVAATAVSAEQGQITIYIAANRGRPRHRDRENGETFKQLLRETIGQSDPVLIACQLMKAVSPIIYHRLVRKVDLMTKIDKTELPKLLIQDRFDLIVDRWAEGGNMEDGVGFLSLSAKCGTPSMDGNQCVKDVFGLIVSAATSTKGGLPADAETCWLRVSSFTLQATTLLESKFFKSFDKPGPENQNPIPDEDFIWILRLRRRLWRIARYLAQSNTFAFSGLPFIRNILGEDGSKRFADGGPGVKIVCVGDESGVLPDNYGHEVEMCLPPMEFLNKLFDKFDYTAEGEKNIPAIPRETLTDIGKFWEIPGSIKPFLHCEIQMILYLQANNIQIQENAIGCSKLMCWACNAYVEKANKERGGKAGKAWLLSGTSEKPHHAWLVPSGVLGDAIVSDIMKGLESLVSWFAVEFGRHRKQLSGGSDSATGSDDDEDTLITLALRL